MKYAAAALGGAAVTFIAMSIAISPTVEYNTEVVERIVIDEQLTTLDLEQLRDDIDSLDDQLYDECVHIIARHTHDRVQGIRNYVDRHYDGDACKAAAEVQRGDW